MVAYLPSSRNKKLSLLFVITLGLICLNGCTASPTLTDTDKTNINRPQTSVTWCITAANTAKVCYDPVTTNYGDSAFISLQKLDARETSVEFKSQEYKGSGFFVTGINGVENTKTKSWKLYVNSFLSSESVSKIVVQNNDELDFKYEEIR